MRAEDLVFWLDVLPEGPDSGPGVLCRRHADSMMVPRGWTLDDLRDPDLRLFRPPLPAPSLRSPVPRAARTQRPPVEVASTPLPFEADEASVDCVDDVADDPGPWTPTFDEADDLDGLLSARSPLLSRAFRIADRPVD